VLQCLKMRRNKCEIVSCRHIAADAPAAEGLLASVVGIMWGSGSAKVDSVPCVNAIGRASGCMHCMRVRKCCCLLQSCGPIRWLDHLCMMRCLSSYLPKHTLGCLASLAVCLLLLLLQMLLPRLRGVRFEDGSELQRLLRDRGRVCSAAAEVAAAAGRQRGVSREWAGDQGLWFPRRALPEQCIQRQRQQQQQRPEQECSSFVYSSSSCSSSGGSSIAMDGHNRLHQEAAAGGSTHGC
jgi:hypothetical protein